MLLQSWDLYRQILLIVFVRIFPLFDSVNYVKVVDPDNSKQNAIIQAFINCIIKNLNIIVSITNIINLNIIVSIKSNISNNRNLIRCRHSPKINIQIIQYDKVFYKCDLINTNSPIIDLNLVVQSPRKYV